MQHHRHTFLALDQHTRQLLGRSLRQRSDGFEIGQHPRIRDHLLAVPALHPVLADVGDTVDVQRVAQEHNRASADHRDETDESHQRRQRVARGGKRNGRARFVDDRREGTIEVDEDRHASGMLDQRAERVVHGSLGAEDDDAARGFAPVGGGLGIASTFGAPSTEVDTVVHSRSKPAAKYTMLPVRSGASAGSRVW